MPRPGRGHRRDERDDLLHEALELALRLGQGPDAREVDAGCGVPRGGSRRRPRVVRSGSRPASCAEGRFSIAASRAEGRPRARAAPSVTPGPGGREGAGAGAASASVVRRQCRRTACSRPTATLLGRGVVRRREPPVAEPGDPAQPGVRPPAPDPDGWAIGMGGAWLQDLGPAAVASPQVAAQRADRRVEPGPALLEVHPCQREVGLRRTRAHAQRQPPSGQKVQGGRRLGQRRRSTDDGKGDRRGQGQVAARLDHAGQRHDPVQPWPLEDQVVVRRECPEPQPLRGRVRTTPPRPPASPVRRSRSAAGARRTPSAERTRAPMSLQRPRGRS